MSKPQGEDLANGRLHPRLQAELEERLLARGSREGTLSHQDLFGRTHLAAVASRKAKLARRSR